MSANKIVGNKIKLLREAKGMTQQELADKVGGDRQYINKIEAGKKNMTLNYIDKIAEALDAPPSEFLNTEN